MLAKFSRYTVCTRKFIHTAQCSYNYVVKLITCIGLGFECERHMVPSSPIAFVCLTKDPLTEGHQSSPIEYHAQWQHGPLEISHDPGKKYIVL